ncbi:MAG: hypothetical protein CVU54_15895 [Deltaproteobacteria bacterium HGW-Deltaproteobacteria-12]|jgi:hypothetical protein|nr:MAG: hypothetical protein CVU54_15895 [Deltaproteobacteria bacterium HGW-Deltaproteobacteria-12]
MKIYSKSKIIFRSFACAAILGFCVFMMPAPGLALMALPDIGIDYPTMKVVAAAKLKAAGMKKAENGDAVSMKVSSEEQKVIFKNLRTGEQLDYPPEKQRGKER